MRKHKHILLPSGAVATVYGRPPKKLLKALNDLALLAIDKTKMK